MPIDNLFAQLPQQLPEEVFDALLQADGLRIERIVSRGQCSAADEWYDQADNEWVVLLQGAARLGFADGSSRQLGPGDYLHIPAHSRHRVEWTDPEQTSIWLAVHYG
jgi:cupin 2 domain-containing protein